MFQKQYLGFIFFGVGADQLTKFLSHHFLFFGRVDIIPYLLSFQLVHNYGAAYGIFMHYRLFLIIVNVLVLVGLSFFWKHFIFGTVSKQGLVCIFTGAIGNLIDRLFRGFVVDFIDIHFIPVFNIADMLISFGVAFLFYDLFKPYVRRLF